MKLLRKIVFASFIVALFVNAPLTAFAATSPSLGAANSFTLLAGSYVNTVGGTTITGDVGYTTGPATAPTINGTTHVADSVYNQAGIDQNSALSALASQPCTFTFAPGAINLATDTTHGTIGVYAPGVYCASGAVSIGTAGITLTGGGTYIFRMTGALTTAANSSVTLAGGATACDVWWTPSAATTLGANSTFAGTNIDASGITIGSTVNWTGKALAFGGTVSTTGDTLTSTSCTATPTSTGGGSGSGSGTPTTTPGLPNTGTILQDNPLWWIVPVAVLVAIPVMYLTRKKA